MTDSKRTTPPTNRSLRRTATALAAAATLALATPALAHGGWSHGWNAGTAPRAGGPGAMHAPGTAYGPGMMQAPGAAFGPGAMQAPGAAQRIPGAMQGLPLGTEITVTTYAEDPTEGAAPLDTLTATVGEVSEVAFAEEIRAAAAEAAYLRIDVGERTQRVELPDTASLDPELPRRAAAGRLPGLRTLEQGQTVEVAVYASAEDASPQATLSFTYGEDSAAAFRAELNDALDEAAILEVTLPAHERTVDLSALPAGLGAQDGAFGPGMGWRDAARGPAMGFQDGSYGPGTGFQDGPRGPGTRGRW